VALVAGAPAAGAAGPRLLVVDQPAPPIVLGDQHGTPFRLADLLARRDFVVVAFYVKAFTGG
jgi:peroxiredoxin